jgi:glutathione S-transferase
LIVHTFGAGLGLGDLSPFCLKLQTWLRLAGIDHEVVSGNPRKAPKGKLPYVELDGRVLADSRFIIEALTTRYGVTLDAAIEPADRAVAVAFRTMVEEGLYFAVVYFRWVEEAGWAVFGPAVERAMAEAGIPRVMRGQIARLARRSVIKALKTHGVANHSADEVEAIAVDELRALEEWLGGRSFCLGEAPTSFDASLYAMVASALAPQPPTRLAKRRSAFPRLTAYCERVADRCHKPAS